MKTFIILVFYLFYWMICYINTGTDKKNLMGLRSYPDEVQQIVLNHLPEQEIPKKKSILSILLANLILFTVVFSILGFSLKEILGLNDFKTAFLFFLIFGEGLGLFDLVIIDLLWWRNTPRIRFSFLPQKQYYQDASKHVASFLRGLGMFLFVALFSALISTREII